MATQRTKTIAYWIVTILGPASFVIGGVLHLAQHPQPMASLAHLGYPAYFAAILGAAKLLGAIAVVIPGTPRLKEWAYAGFTFMMASAVYSHLSVGDGPEGYAPPAVFLALTLASWALRPPSRRLPASGGERAAPLAPSRAA